MQRLTTALSIVKPIINIQTSIATSLCFDALNGRSTLYAVWVPFSVIVAPISQVAYQTFAKENKSKLYPILANATATFASSLIFLSTLGGQYTVPVSELITFAGLVAVPTEIISSIITDAAVNKVGLTLRQFSLFLSDENKANNHEIEADYQFDSRAYLLPR